MAEGAPNPAETEAAAQETAKEPESEAVTEQVSEQPPVAPVVPTPPKPPRWQFWRRESKPISSAEEERRDFEQENQQLTSNWQERLKTLDNNPESLIHFLSLMNAKEYQEYRIQEKHGKTLSKFQKVTRGDLTFELTKEGQVRYNVFRELANRAAKVFDRETLTALGLYGVVGLTMGGFGIPGLAALAGKIGGRAGVEVAAAISGHEREAQRSQAELMATEWAELTALAGRYQQEKVNLSLEQKAEIQTEIINRFYNKSEDMARAEGQLAEREEVWQGRRDKMGKILSLVGGATGLVTGLTGLTNMIHWANMDGDKVHHAVRIVDGTWQFAYNAGENVVELSKNIYHVMGPNDGWKIMGNVAAGLAGVFGGFKLGELLNRSAQKDEEMLARQEAENRTAQREAMLGAVPQPEPTPEPSAPGGAAAEVELAIPEHYQELAKAEESSLPQVGKIWIYRDVGGLGMLKIINLDFQNNLAVVEILNQNFEKVEDGSYRIDDLIKKGNEKSAFVNDWLLSVPEGGKVRIGSEQKILDRLDPKGEKTVPAEDYVLRRIKEKPSQAELVKEGQEKQRVNIFDLAFWGARPLEPEKKTAEKVKAPKVKDIWAKRPDVGELPEVFAGMEKQQIVISDVEDGVIYFRGGDRAIEDINLFVKYFRKVGAEGGGGGGGGGERRGGRR